MLALVPPPCRQRMRGSVRVVGGGEMERAEAGGGGMVLVVVVGACRGDREGFDDSWRRGLFLMGTCSVGLGVGNE